MYRREKSITLKGSVSALSNNLSVRIDMARSTIHYAVVHRYTVNLVSASMNGQTVNSRQVVCKEPSVNYCSSIIQARLVALPTRTVLVLTSQYGIQMFDADSTLMLYWYAVGDLGKAESFSRGVCDFQDESICVGTHSGSIIVFHIPARGSNFTLHETLEGHKEAICDLQSDQDHLFSSDDSGSIIIWMGINKKLKQMIVIQGFGSPCTSLAVWNDYVIGGYGSGHLRVFSTSHGDLCAEVTAHAKWINAIDIAKSSGMLLSAGEDSMIHVWQLSSSSPQVAHLHSECVTDTQLQGAKFITADGKAFACTGYDCCDIFFYTVV